MVPEEPFGDCLSVRDGRLFVEECDTSDLAERYGTPLFVLSEAKLRSNLRRFRRAFQEGWPGPVDILPAFKANWTLATRRILTEERAGADVYSEGELHGVLATGTDPEMVSVNGGGKSEAFIERCLRAGVRITIEDLDEPELIQKVAGRLGQVAKVRLRVKPDFPNLWRTTDFSVPLASIDLGIQAYKSGIPAQYLPELGRQVLGMSNLELTGLHLHVGRHSPSLWFWRGVMKRYGRLIAELCRHWDYRPQEIDIGGGFASGRDPFHKAGPRGDLLSTLLTYPAEQVLRLLGDRSRYAALSAVIRTYFSKRPSRKRPPSIEEYGQTTGEALRSGLLEHGLRPEGIRLQVEPGRGMYGDTGVHLTRVRKVKRQTKPMRLTWVLTDTTWFYLTAGVLENFLHDFRIASRADAEPSEVADVVGRSCTADRILPFVRLPPVQPGDVIAFLDTGAYMEVSASNFNAMPRPATVLVHGDRADVIRRAERTEEVFARDVVPGRLQADRGVDHESEKSRRMVPDFLPAGDAGLRP
jgi:diaminopimelate decarboxylase